jgi:molybdate-binding protein/DNA-binding transcriptional regulator YhcF (GntR family)
MEEMYLYRQIADAVRRQILHAELKPGDRLPTVREMMARWSCTIGTVQRAYQELSRQGLVVSHAGQGTRVVDSPPRQDETPLRRAGLIHRAEAFLLEVLTAGYSPADVEEAVRQALERWRVVSQTASTPAGEVLRFSGSHDLAVAWLATHFGEIARGCSLQLNFTGSLGGLIALAEGKADLAGCHLWDEETDTYNLPFVRRLFPGQRVALVTLAHRQIGLIVTPGNPGAVQGLADLARPGLRFVNRQSGSGTRVWLDAMLHRQGIQPSAIQGYRDEKMTHTEVANTIAEGSADAGLGLEGAARPYGLGFVPLTLEQYDLVIPARHFGSPLLQAVIDWLRSPAARQAISSLAGYQTISTGEVKWINPI